MAESTRPVDDFIADENEDSGRAEDKRERAIDPERRRHDEFGAVFNAAELKADPQRFDIVVHLQVKHVNFSERTPIFRGCGTQVVGEDSSIGPIRISENSSIPKNDENFGAKAKAAQFSSQPATAFASAGSGSLMPAESFGNEYFTSDDVALENHAEEPAKRPLDTCDQDVSDIAPNFRPTFNFAAYADKSPMIQELAKLGVELYKLERHHRPMEFLLQRNFDDLKPHIRFLADAGVPADGLGAFITKNPKIFTQNVDDLHTRIRYLRAHNYSVDMIARIVSANPFWLMFNTKRIDARLGFFQQHFQLNGHNVRFLSARQPRIITYSLMHVKETTFAMKEEMGFDQDQTRRLLLAQPRLFMKSRRHIVEIFDYLHNTMKLSHELLCSQPKVLTCRLLRLKARHQYLETLGKNQYDPKEPLYVSPDAFVSGSDVEFCMNVAKTSVDTYNLFQKTL